MAFIYKGAILDNKIILPTNYLAHFYSAWSTQKFPDWEQGIPNKPLGTDLLRFFYPGYTFTLSQLKNFELPLWNPYIFSGNPHLANFQSAVFYPLTWLGSWPVLIIIPPFLAFLFCYLYLKALNLSTTSCLFGAFAFGFSGFMITWSQEAVAVAHSAIWLPLIFYGLEKKSLVVTVLAMTMSILAGYLQITFYIFALAFFYSFYRKNLWLFSLSWLYSLGLSAIQLIPSFEAFRESVRPVVKIEGVFTNFLLSPLQLIKTVAPDITGHPGSYNYFGTGSYNETILYIGLIPLIFAIFGYLKSKFFAIAAVSAFILTSNLPLVKNLLMGLPLISTFQPSRILVLTTFCLSVLAAYGLNNYSKRIKFIPPILILVLIVSIIYLKLYLILPRDFLVAFKNTVLPFGFLVTFFVLTFIKSKRLFLVLIFILTIFGQYYFFTKYLNLGEKEFLYPNHFVFSYLQKTQKNFERFVAMDEPIFGNYATQMQVYSPEGFDPIFSKRYGQLAAAAKNAPGLQRIEVTLSEPIATNSARVKKLFNLLGVKNVLRYQNNQWQTTLNEDAFPRTFLVDNYIVEPDPQKILDKIYDPNFDLSITVILEEPYLGSYPVLQDDTPQNKAEIVSYEPQKVVITTRSDSSKLLFLSDNYYPGWKAYVDDTETKIYRANFSFRAVSVPAGTHSIKFIYDPLSLKIGAIITLVAICFLIFFGIRSRSFHF